MDAPDIHPETCDEDESHAPRQREPEGDAEKRRVRPRLLIAEETESYLDKNPDGDPIP